MGGDNGDKAPSNALEGPRRRARSGVCDRTTGGRCAGASRYRAAEERVDKAQDERAIKAQDKPEAVGKVHEDEAPSNALEGPRRQAKWSARGRTIGGWRTGV